VQVLPIREVADDPALSAVPQSDGLKGQRSHSRCLS
jgi:hypothetical protein